MLEKPAPVDHPVHPLIRDRWSPRSFADRPVEPDKILSILEAGRWAASCFNWQPWHFVIATRDNAEEHARMLDCLIPWNAGWAVTAPLLMLSFAAHKVPGKDDPNPHNWHDVGLASAQMLLQATDLGLRGHIMAGIEVDKIRETYGVPDDVDPVAAIAFGYGGDPDALSEKLAAREHEPRQRNELRDYVYAGAWGRTAPVVP